MKKPDPPPPGGKNYAENKAILKAREDAEKAERLGYEQGYTFGKTLGDAQEGLKTLNSSTGGRFERTLETNPKLVEELQTGLAAKLNAIPALPADVKPKLARPGFERGFRAGLLDAKLAAVVVDFATNVALALSGDLALLAEQAGAAVLKGAIARFKSMPVFLPATIGGGGGFVRLPKPQIAQAARGATAPAAGGKAWTPPSKATAKIPSEWGAGAANKKAVGMRWEDPRNPGNGVRIDQGNPASSFPSQQVDHVVVRSGGKVIGRDGAPILGSIKEQAEAAHIPLSEWLQWAIWNSPK